MSIDSDDAHHLLNRRKDGPKTASNSGNFYLVATEVNSSSPFEFFDDVEITLVVRRTKFGLLFLFVA